MILKELLWIFVGTFCSADHIGPEGCGRGWRHFKDYCYLAVDAAVHFDSAKAVCRVKGATLTSIWGQEEMAFITKLMNNLNVMKPHIWIGTGVVRSKWMWLDGSGNLDVTFKDTKISEATKDVCGFLKPDGTIDFVDCDVTKPAFVCKKPLDIVYVPSTVNITKKDIGLPTRNLDEIIFERLWPPFLDRIILNMTSSNYLATVEVAHETDCAYRCYTVDECLAFAVVCKAARKCNTRFCRLFSGLDVT